jgi:Tol biopolymer transport system component
MDPAGATTLLRATPANWFTPHVAPDGRRLAMEIRQGQSDIWIYDSLQDRLTAVTSDAARDAKPVWSPDGHRIVYGSARDDGLVLNLYSRRADGIGQPQRLTMSRNSQEPGSWHPSGRFLAFEETTAPQNVDVMILPIRGNEASGLSAGAPEAFLNSDAIEAEPMFSPDGRWLAYMSRESEQLEVYVRPFPASDARWKISNNGGTAPTWSLARQEIYYGVNGQILAVPYTVEGDEFKAGAPKLWSQGRYQMRGHIRMFDLHPDGGRFAVASAEQTPGGIRQDHVTFIFNFFAELHRRAPAAGR